MMEKIPFLVEILPYVQKFRDTVFVIKLGGDCVSSLKTLEGIAGDICTLHSLGINVAVVHGGGPQADELQNKLGYPVVKVSGRRVTDKNTLEVAKMVYGGKINSEIVATLQKLGANAVGISGASAGTIVASKREVKRVRNEKTGRTEEIDYGYVGDIAEINTKLINLLLGGGFIPVVACLGTDNNGNILNINADNVAGRIAAALNAEKFISVTNVPGLLEDKSKKMSVVSYLDVAEARKWLKSGKVSEGMLPKLESCIAAVESGVRRAHIIDGALPHSILTEVFTNHGCGTMIVNRKTDVKNGQQNAGQNSG